MGKLIRAVLRGRGDGNITLLPDTHISGESRRGRFQVERRTIAQRFRTKLAEVKVELRRRMPLSVPVQGAWLRSVVLGHYRYYGVPHNAKALQRFRKEVARLWQRSLSRRSHKGYVTWDRMKRYVEKWLPIARIYHPYPDQRFGVMTRGKSPVR
jgi:RNA-directed DNA polymerase